MGCPEGKERIDSPVWGQQALVILLLVLSSQQASTTRFREALQYNVWSCVEHCGGSRARIITERIDSGHLFYE